MNYYLDIFNVLRNYYKEEAFLKNILDIYIKKNKIDGANIITDYVYGIVRNDIYLAHLIKLFVKKIKNKDQIYMKILFYGIIFRENTKNEIFINDLIRYIKKKYGIKKAGFFNGVARNLLRNNDLINEVNKNQQIYHSIPVNLYRYIENNIDDISLKQKIYDKMTEVPSFYFRINKLSDGDKELIKKIKNNHIWENIYRFNEKLKLSEFKNEMKEKKIIIQDISSQMIAQILEPKKNEYIADFCSAPGGKTTLLSELSDNNAKILSIEMNQKRFEKLIENTKYYKNVVPLLADASKPVVLNGEIQTFDKILVDAPCSALGTVSKSPDKKYRFSSMNLSDYTKIQVSILNNALKHLKKGGILLYSLCTFTKEECVDSVELFLAQNKDEVELFDFRTPDKKFKGNKFYTANYYNGDLFFITRFRKKT